MPPYVPPGGPPQGPRLDPRMYAELGEEGIRRLLYLHYERLGQSSIKDLFPGDLREAADRSADFFVQLMGGPPLYVQKHGPPRMRARHLPFPITEERRAAWLACFHAAMQELPFPAHFAAEFSDFLDSFSAWMVNTE